MKKETTNIVTSEDVRKIKSMVHHKMNNTVQLHPGVHYDGERYRIDGITHLDSNTINMIQTKCSVQSLKHIIKTEFNLDYNNESVKRSKVLSIENIGKKDDYVYDVSVNGFNHYFFANNILVHNTDSVYFSVAQLMKLRNQPFDLNKDQVVELYQAIGKNVGDSFPSFMNDTFNTGIEKGSIIGADLEMVGSRGLFLKKKRYAILKYWDDGFRVDTDGKPGKIKAMGLEIKRSDTAKYIQVFLEDTLVSLLAGATEKELKEKVRAFKKQFRSMDAVDKGSPKTVKKLTKWTEEYNDTGKCSVGHVLAAIQWNKLRSVNDDKLVPEATDGTKVMVCNLKNNIYGIKSIGYPVECREYLPDWFKELPFDEDEMEQKVLIKKMENIFGILDMDIGIHETESMANCSMFEF